MRTPIHLSLEHRQITLRRHPVRQRETHQAWDGADRYMLHHRMKHFLPPLLVVNDEFGALAIGASHRGEVHHWNDSWVAQYNWRKNAELNGLEAALSHWHWPLETLPTVGEVWLKVPKTLALLEYQLQRLTTELAPGTPIYLAWLDKHIPARLLELVRAQLQKVELLPGKFKAHGLVGQAKGAGCMPGQASSTFQVPFTETPLLAHPGVFAQQQLDIGTRFMLEHFPKGQYEHIVDLACGSGVLGLYAAQNHPKSHLCFADESSLAMASAQANWQALFPQREAEFFHGNGLWGWQGQADLILLNPPFHQGHTLDTGVAFMLFSHAAKKLAPQGEVWVVANQHLGYEKHLRRYFRGVALVARHPKFVLLKAWNSKFSKSHQK